MDKNNINDRESRVLDFINVNYIWLILIAIVVLLALVGYIADKQGYSR